MRPFYTQQETQMEIFQRKSKHVSPHLHKAMECILVTEGTLELGMGTELFHMEKNDFAIIFPEVIHHYQVFDTRRCRAIHLLASPVLGGGCLQTLSNYCPKVPVIPAARVHPDISYAMKSLLSTPAAPENHMIQQAFVQIILARSLPFFQLIEKSSVGGDDIVCQAVSYIAGHFTEKITLPEMAHSLGVSPYALSRIFSGVFHTNFNQYLNDTRLEYACSLLEHTGRSITEIWCDSGFDSQRTFNRVFKERCHMTPKEYRALRQNKHSETEEAQL